MYQQYGSGKCPCCGACLHCGARQSQPNYWQQIQGPIYVGMGIGVSPLQQGLSNTMGAQQPGQNAHSCNH